MFVGGLVGRGCWYHRAVVERWIHSRRSTAPTVGKLKGLLLSTSSSGGVGSVRAAPTQVSSLSSSTAQHPEIVVATIGFLIALFKVHNSLDSKMETHFNRLDSKMETMFNHLDAKMETNRVSMDTMIDGFKKDVIDAINSKLDAQDRRIDAQDRKIDALDRKLDGVYRTRIDGRHRDETRALVIDTTLPPGRA